MKYLVGRCAEDNSITSVYRVLHETDDFYDTLCLWPPRKHGDALVLREVMDAWGLEEVTSEAAHKPTQAPVSDVNTINHAQ